MRIIILLFFICFFIGCATFNKKRFRQELINVSEKDISKFNGEYSYYPIQRYYDKTITDWDNNLDSLKRISNFYDDIINKQPERGDFSRKYDDELYVELSFVDRTKFEVKLKKNQETLRDTIISGRFKNGMFYLKNNFRKCHGIPYLFGGCENSKVRIGLSKNGNLLINNASDSSGSFLIFIGDGHSSNETMEYSKK